MSREARIRKAGVLAGTGFVSLSLGVSLLALGDTEAATGLMLAAMAVCLLALIQLYNA